MKGSLYRSMTVGSESGDPDSDMHHHVAIADSGY
jgi:hypothetical protein